MSDKQHFMRFVARAQEKKKIPENIQKAIDDYKQLHGEVELEEPKEVCLNSVRDYDDTKHRDDIIIFPPGGKVGDMEWKFQYMHNMSVTVGYNEKKERIENPHYAPETFIYLEKYREKLSQIQSVQFYHQNFLIDKIDFVYLHMYNNHDFIDLEPKLPPLERQYVFYIRHPCPQQEVEVFIEFLNGKEEIEIYECKY